MSKLTGAGQPPECFVPLQRFSRLIEERRKWQAERRQLVSQKAGFELERRRAERARERDRRQRANRAQFFQGLQPELPQGGYDQPGVPLGAGAAFEAGRYIGETVRDLAPDFWSELIDQKQEEIDRLDAAIAQLDQPITALREEMLALGCRFNRAL